MANNFWPPSSRMWGKYHNAMLSNCSCCNLPMPTSSLPISLKALRNLCASCLILSLASTSGFSTISPTLGESNLIAASTILSPYVARTHVSNASSWVSASWYFWTSRISCSTTSLFSNLPNSSRTLCTLCSSSTIRCCTLDTRSSYIFCNLSYSSSNAFAKSSFAFCTSDNWAFKLACFCKNSSDGFVPVTTCFCTISS